MSINDELIEKIWRKANEVKGYNPDLIRKDPCDAWIRRDKYGDRKSPFGWEIDHVMPRAKLESRNVPVDEIDDELNLRAMNWMNNDSKKDDYPTYHSSVTADEERNKEVDEVRTVDDSLQLLLDNVFGKYFV